MKVIGLCGGSGSGKTAACEIFSDLGAAIINTDRVYRELCAPGSPCMEELKEAFGCGIIRQDGSLDREALGSIVFSDREALLTLDGITHRYIKAETLARIERYRMDGYDAVIVDAPLLFEAEFDRFCDITAGIVADRSLRISRIIERDGITHEAAERRISSQLSDDELRRRCDYIIDNNGDTSELFARVRSFYLKAVIETARGVE